VQPELNSLRYSLAFVWIAAGVVSAGLYPVEASLALLAPLGLSGTPARVALYAGAALDIALGLATLLLPRRRALWLVQGAVVVGYTAIITVYLPDQWLHPFGAVVKNVPILAVIWVLYRLEPR
jgi:hypothetical protein